MYFSQKFIAVVVQRFQNINPDSDGAHIKGPWDLKNEIQIITLPTELWTSWKTFLNKHTEGKLINPDTDKMFKEDRKFKLKQQTLKREFFKHCGHFTDRDFGVLAQHLIGATPAWTILYPKVSVARTRYLAPSNHSHADWVERRKRKKVILQDFMALNTDLHFIDEGGDVLDDVWRLWKKRHRFTIASWDFLLSAPKADYFRRRLQNEAWSKRITDMQAQIPEVHCRASLLEECPQHHGHKRNPGVTPGTCGAIGERAQVILVWVRGPGRWERLPPTETRSHEG